MPSVAAAVSIATRRALPRSRFSRARFHTEGLRWFAAMPPRKRRGVDDEVSKKRESQRERKGSIASQRKLNPDQKKYFKNSTAAPGHNNGHRGLPLPRRQAPGHLRVPGRPSGRERTTASGSAGGEEEDEQRAPAAAASRSGSNSSSSRGSSRSSASSSSRSNSNDRHRLRRGVRGHQPAPAQDAL